MTLRAGVARTDITPPVGIAHAGWGAQTHERAAGVDLPLWATAIALEADGTSAIIVDIDLVYLWGDDATRVRNRVSELTGVARSAVRLSYTHTHSGPYTPRDSWIEAGSEMVDSYLDGLADRIAGAAWEAFESAQPVNLDAGRGRCGIAVNRRFVRPEDGRIVVGQNPDGPVDHTVGVVRFDGVNGDPVATIAHYTCHPTTVGPDNDLITPDYPGVMKRVVEKATGSTCLFLQGAAGDVGPVRGTARGGINEYRSLGRRLGHEVARVWEGLDPLGRESRYVETLESGAPLAVYEDHPSPVSPPLRVATETLELPVRNLAPVEEVRQEYEAAKNHLDSLEDDGRDQGTVQEATMRTKRAKIQLDLVEEFGDRSVIEYELQTIALGRVALVAMPGEPFVEAALRIKQQSPMEFTFFSGYSNEGHCYIPTDMAYGEGGYEVDRTPVQPGAIDRIESVAVAVVEDINQRVSHE